MTFETLALQGHPGVHSSMAASITARIKEVRSTFIKESFGDFQHIEHRIEYVANVHGIEFINDSRSTNINSTWFTLESMTKPIIWIAGGKDSGIDYSQVKSLLRTKIKSIIFLGIDSEYLISVISDFKIPISDASSMEEAVELAYLSGAMGDVVLLSPGCPSFGLFKNYEERGNEFKKAVNQL